MLNFFPASQIEHLAQGIAVGTAELILGDLLELADQTLDDIGRVYVFPDLGGICEKGAQVSQFPSQFLTQEGLSAAWDSREDILGSLVVCVGVSSRESQ